MTPGSQALEVTLVDWGSSLALSQFAAPSTEHRRPQFTFRHPFKTISIERAAAQFVSLAPLPFHNVLSDSQISWPLIAGIWTTHTYSPAHNSSTQSFVGISRLYRVWIDVPTVSQRPENQSSIKSPERRRVGACTMQISSFQAKNARSQLRSDPHRSASRLADWLDLSFSAGLFNRRKRTEIGSAELTHPRNTMKTRYLGIYLRKQLPCYLVFLAGQNNT